MKLIFLPIVFLVIACIQVISASDFHTNSTSGKLQTQVFLGSIKGAVVKFEEKKNKQKYELSSTSRKAHSGKGATGGGSSDVNRRPRRNFAPSLLSRPLFCASVLTLYVSLALILGLVFPFY